ncbi:MAG: hypothetical protein ICV81_14260 [Flavisolibacter sp.]|nr:hypothetical protein [Flavisolibacter sp.]
MNRLGEARCIELQREAMDFAHAERSAGFEKIIRVLGQQANKTQPSAVLSEPFAVFTEASAVTAEAFAVVAEVFVNTTEGFAVCAKTSALFVRASAVLSDRSALFARASAVFTKAFTVTAEALAVLLKGISFLSRASAVKERAFVRKEYRLAKGTGKAIKEALLLCYCTSCRVLLT